MRLKIIIVNGGILLMLSLLMLSLLSLLMLLLLRMVGPEGSKVGFAGLGPSNRNSS